MTPATRTRFRAFADAHLPSQPVDAASGLRGADLHAIADALNQLPTDNPPLVAIPELALSGGAVGLRPVLV